MTCPASRRLWGVLIALGLCAPLACKPGKPATGVSQSQSLEDKVIAQARTIAQRDEQLAAQAKLIQELRQLKGDKAIDKLVHVDRIQIERLSGPYDDDRNGVSDGIVTYLSLFDQDGDACKAAGSATVRLLDLSATANPQTIAEASWTPEQLRSLWYGRFMTQHYTLRIPWPEKWKAHPPQKLTIVAQFTDLLTGRSLSAQQAIDLSVSSDGEGLGSTAPVSTAP